MRKDNHNSVVVRVTKNNGVGQTKQTYFSKPGYTYIWDGCIYLVPIVRCSLLWCNEFNSNWNSNMGWFDFGSLL